MKTHLIISCCILSLTLALLSPALAETDGDHGLVLSERLDPTLVTEISQRSLSENKAALSSLHVALAESLRESLGQQTFVTSEEANQIRAEFMALNFDLIVYQSILKEHIREESTGTATSRGSSDRSIGQRIAEHEENVLEAIVKLQERSERKTTK